MKLPREAKIIVYECVDYVNLLQKNYKYIHKTYIHIYGYG